jgi:capsular polysaccharide biosynthesis protein
MQTLAEVTQVFLNMYENKTYLEINRYYDGSSSSLDAHKKVVVAQDVQPGTPTQNDMQLHAASSDEYFYSIGKEERFNVILLDGVHTFEQTYRDLQNALLCLEDGGVIIIDDIMPNSYLASLPDINLVARIRKQSQSEDQSWMGDVYKLAFLIEGYFQQFSFAAVRETGRQLVMWRAPRRAASMRPMRLEHICRLGYADALDRQGDLNTTSLGEIIAAVRAGQPVGASHTEGTPSKQMSALPVDHLRARRAPWAADLIGFEGRKLIAGEVPLTLPEMRCVNAEILSQDALASYTKLNANREKLVPSISAYALEDVILLPHGALLVDGNFVEEPLSRIPQDDFMKEVSAYYNALDERGRGDESVSTMRTPLIVIEQPGMFNYGHVLVEMLPKLIPFLSDLRSGNVKIALQSKYVNYTHILGLFNFLGIKQKSIVWFDISGDSEWDFVRVPRLIYVSPISRHLHPSYKAPWGIETLSRITSGIKPKVQRRIFISRKDAYNRFLVNEDQIFSIFEKLGYERLCTGAMPFEEQVALFKGATHIAGVYGASLTNVVFCGPGAKMLMLCPSNSIDPFYWELASERGVSYVHVAGRPVEGQEGERNCDFHVDEKDLRSIIGEFDADVDH